MVILKKEFNYKESGVPFADSALETKAKLKDTWTAVTKYKALKETLIL